MVSMHTSPVASPGSADAGGMNVVEVNTAIALAARGHRVDMLTRRDDPGLPEVLEVVPGANRQAVARLDDDFSTTCVKKSGCV